MLRSKPFAWLLVILGSGLLVTAGLMLSLQPVAAQCGSESTTCKSCHEVKATYSVNTVGVWHTDHAADDFCADCHAGNASAADPALAHADMVVVLDETARCQTCHPDEAEALIATYQEALAALPASSAPVVSAASADPLDAPVDPLDAPVDPLDAPVSTDPLDAPPATVQQTAAPVAAAAAEVVAEDAPNTGNQILVVLAEVLGVAGLGIVITLERRK